MDLGLQNKVAFIAASSDGLGKAVATELLREGATVIINGRTPDRLAATQDQLERLGKGRVEAIPGDLSVPEDRKEVINAVLKKHPSLHILVTNTGGPPAGKFEDIHPDEWDKTYQLLLKSAVELIRGLLPIIKKEPWGRIICITSQAVKQPVDNLILSNAVRASVVGLVKTLAGELARYNITVNNVMPGYTETARLKKLLHDHPAFAEAINEIPLGRFGKPEEFAAAVVFLASERASYITGTSLAIDGGWIKGLL